jgi:YD repeat-containing protein
VKCLRSRSVTHTSTFTYNALGWLLSEETSGLGTVSYEYDAYGRRSKLTWPDAVNITYTYDNASHLTGVYRFGGGLVQFTYDVQGRRFGTGRANGATTYYGYDGLSRPSYLFNYVNAADDLFETFLAAEEPCGEHRPL